MCPIGPSSNKGKKKKIIFFKGPIKVLARVNFQRDYWFITKKKKTVIRQEENTKSLFTKRKWEREEKAQDSNKIV